MAKPSLAVVTMTTCRAGASSATLRTTLPRTWALDLDKLHNAFALSSLYVDLREDND